jgi:peptidoglycan/xylan/chitin deacetylase (PgdA/CDA1 family)
VRVPVLTYHGLNVNGRDYANNDHVALRQDLALIRRLGWRVVPLHGVVAALIGEAPDDFARSVAIAFDDGAWFDWYDLEHPSHGPQRSFANSLREHRALVPDRAADVHATSFVIVSPGAREILDRTCMIGSGWWGDEWWPAADAEGLIAIESHSWDHNHDTLPETAQRDGRKGTFRNIDTWAEADAELRQAGAWLDRVCPGHRTTLFAYPYGETSEYLVREYLPGHVHEHGLRAAFTTEPAPIESGSPRWLLPRYVCGHHWRKPGELEALLRSLD